MSDRLVAGECFADGLRAVGGAPLAGGHPSGVQEPKQEARRIVSVDWSYLADLFLFGPHPRGLFHNISSSERDFMHHPPHNLGCRYPT